MEREMYRQVPTEELLTRMFMSWFLTDWHFRYYEYLELAARAGSAMPVGLVGAGVGISKGVGNLGREGFKQLTA